MTKTRCLVSEDIGATPEKGGVDESRIDSIRLLRDILEEGNGGDVTARRVRPACRVGPFSLIGATDRWQSPHLLSPVANHFPGRVATASTHHAASRMGGTAAEVEAVEGSTVIGPAGDRSQVEQLVQGHGTLKDIAASASEGPFQINR